MAGGVREGQHAAACGREPVGRREATRELGWASPASGRRRGTGAESRLKLRLGWRRRDSRTCIRDGQR